MRKSLFPLVLFTGCAFSFQVFAATQTWNGQGSNDNWSNPHNWVGGTVPSPGDDIVFDGAVASAANVNLDFSSTLPGFTLASLTFQRAVNTEFSGTGLFNVGATAGCPELICNVSNAIWTSGTTLNLDGALELNTTNGVALFQFANLTGSGNLTVDATLTATFTAANTTWMANNITIDGTVNLNASNALPAAAVALSSSGELNLNGNSASIGALTGNGTIYLSSGSSSGTLTTNGIGTYSGVIRNGVGNVQPGSVNVRGFALTLAGANTYSGGTTIGSGTLIISSTSNLGTPTNSTYLLTFNGSGATLQPAANFNLAPNSGLGIYLTGGSCIINLTDFSMGISCPISGPQGLIVSGGNTLTLRDEATYLGGTILTGGSSLAISNGGSLPTVGTVNVMSGSTLDISLLTSPATSVIGPLAGGGNVSLGSNTLEVNSGSIAATFNGSLTDGGSGGGFIKSGSAAFSLTGVNTYLGPTQINGGSLVIGVGGVGSLTNSPVTVRSGGTLQGTGTIAGTVTVQSGGTISGGNSIGTIHIGTLMLDPGANLTLEINNTGASTVYDVTNTATLGGNLAVTVDRGIYQAGTTYTFITTGSNGRIGTFDTVTSNTFRTTTLTGRLDYGSDFVQLVLFAPIYPIIPLDGLTGNAKNVAEYLNSLSAYPEVQPVLLAVGALPPEQAEEALDSISPARGAISSWTAQNALFGVNQVAVNRMLQQRYMRWIETNQPAIAGAFDELLEFEDRLLALQELPTKQKKEPYGKLQTAAKGDSYYTIWAEALDLFARQNAIHQNPAYHSSTGCGLVGADFYNFKNGQMGTALGYAQSSIQESGTGHGSIQYYLAGLYGTAYIDDGYVELSLWSSFDQFHNTRDVVYPGFSAAAKSDHNAWQLVPHIGGGYDFNFSWGALEPFATFDAAALFQQGYSEHGADVLNMRVKSSTSWLLRSEAGLNAYQVIHWASSYLIFREKLSYVNLAPYGIGRLANAALVGFPPGFTVRSFTDVQNMIAPGFELFFKCHNGFFFSLAYEGEFTIGPGNYMSNEAIGKIGCFF